MVMLRMASTEEEERSVGHTPRAKNDSLPDVKVTIGAGHDLDDLGVIEPLPEDKRITININSISARVPLLQQRASLLSRLNPRRIGSSTNKPTHRQVLFDVSGSVRPNEVLALMGPSGSGKTSLLSIMGARDQKQMQSEGTVTFNGQPLTKRLKRRVGYVLQDDLLYESLTVQETLYYAAMLRLPRHMSHEDKLRRIDLAVTALGLGQCKDTIIGGFFRKGISGGERKRVSIGVELLINPSVLMLDEPTSGLDSTTSMHVLTMLRHLASGGRSIVTTIHQPSSRLYQQLDKLLLLSQGHVMYYGAAQQAAEWFSRLGYSLPYGSSLADFILDLASADVSNPERDGEQSRLYLIDTAEAYLRRHPQDGFNMDRDSDSGAGGGATAGPGHISGSGSGSSSPTSISRSDGADIAATRGISGVTVSKLGAQGDIQVAGGSSGALQEEHRWGAPYLTQVSLLFRRSLRTRRFETMKGQDVMQFSAIALLAGLFWLQAGQDNTVLGARNTLGLLFFISMFASFRALFLALYTFPEEYKHMLKERASGMYRLSAFYAARTLSDVPSDFTLPTAFFLVVYMMGGLRYNAAAFFGMYGTMLLTMLVAQGLGLLLGVITMVPKTAQTLASVVMMSMVLTGGFFVTTLPSWLNWVQYLSFIYYALGISLYIQFSSTQLYSCTDPASGDSCAPASLPNPESNPNCFPVYDVQESLALPQNPASQGDAIRNAFVLLGFFIFLRVLVYVVLRRKTARL
ncbi:hypothetical protein D9Q98_006199 [Chlorella vulgaris]|uniref:ABC transporter domain-containing protein n=1 Tax=Chlorella vulgaris TaxID=3077 RepID=A0A9D4TX64_CHLVU|nr:hypothetical protein D9Q98_006199 [Chlorella vulgaris]